ncbi:MAG: serine/threonine-protein kinase, partial [Myxococcota bacterium]
SPDPGEAPPAEAAGLLAPAAAPEEKSQAVRVGNYRVVAAIGKGGMGEIYLARDLESDRLVALKVLAAVDEGDDEALSMLMDEAAIMAQIEHPHVLKVVDFGRSEDRYFLASEYLEGRPLVRVMIESHDREGGLDPAVVACIGAQAARGLHAAHTATSARGTPLEVVHRDVSPQNIFLTYAGEAKVIDFGVARASERVSSTQVGLVKGKAAYMSPEQAEGKELDARSDVFSLGVCLWEMVAGKRLFKQALDYETLVAVQTAQVEPPSPVRGEKPNALDDIILASLERDPSRRTSSADALAAALEGYAHSRGVTDPLGLLAGTMKRLFQEEADRERALMEQLAARSATDEEEASLRHLSGVSQQGPVKSITFVGEPDGLGALDDYGEREPQTGERVLQKVLKLDAERRSGEHPSPWGTGPQPRVVLPPALPRTPRAERHRRSRWPWLAGAGVLALAGSLLFALRGARETAPALSVREVGREALAAPLAAAGARLSPPTGRLQRIEGLPTGPLMLDEGARIARVEGAARAGWLLELTPIDGGPAVAWLESGEPGSVRATALSVNDCPATAQVRAFEGDVELRYGSTRTRVPLGGDGLSDVSVNAPAGADQLTLEPLGLGFGRERAPAGAVICPTAWETADRVVLRRLPPGRYVL